MYNLPEDSGLKKNLYRDHLIEVLAGDGDYWFQCRAVQGGDEETDQSSYASPGTAEKGAKAFIDRKIEANNEPSTLEIKWPWTMLPLSVADEYIEYLQRKIGPRHPLYGKKVFPSCRREDSQDLIVQFDLDDDHTYAIVFFGEKQLFKRKKMPRVETIASFSDLQQRFAQDYLQAMESLNDQAKG
jgi:hypothetical protein